MLIGLVGAGKEKAREGREMPQMAESEK